MTVSFRDAAPPVHYEIDSVDRLVRVNDAWSSFATANGGLHLVAQRVIGRSLWDFVAGEATRQVYKSLLRRVRDGGRARFTYRCDAPERRRFMEMTISAGRGGHVRFDSRTLVVEHAPGLLAWPAAAAPAGLCPCCQRLQEPLFGPGHADAHQHGQALAHEICHACVESLMQSVEYDEMLPDGTPVCLQHMTI